MPLNRAKFHFDTIYGDMNVTIGPYLLYQAGDLCCEPGYRYRPTGSWCTKSPMWPREPVPTAQTAGASP